jgi:RNA polymerase sigma factor (sigma-70 family)
MESVRSTVKVRETLTSEWQRAYEVHADDLLHFLLTFVRDRDTALELLHDTFVRAIRNEDSLRDAHARRSWLFSIAANLARDHRRRAMLYRFVPFVDRPRNQPELDPIVAQVQAALASLSFEQANALTLHYQSGFTCQEIASMSGLSDETVRSRVARGRKNFVAAYRRLERGLKG